MSMYEERYFRARIGVAYHTLCRFVPKAKIMRVRAKQPSREILALGAISPKKHQRAEFLQQLFAAEGDKISAMLRSEYPAVKELVTARSGTGDAAVAYGIDHRGPFVERFEKVFLRRGKKLVRRRVSFEELVLAYQDEDPDKLVTLIRNFITEVILAIEGALLERRR